MCNLSSIVSTLVLSLSFYLVGCANNSQTSGKQAVFSTKAEAEKAAMDFNCTGAHKMGELWMPCKTHAANEEERNNDEHHHHH